MSLPAYDNFDRASIGSNWTTINGGLTTRDNMYAAGLTVDASAYWNVEAANADCYCQATVVAWATSSDLGLGCRQVAGVDTSYILFVGPSTWEFYKVINGVYSQMGVTQNRTTPVGTVVKFSVVGSTLTAYFDGVSDAYTLTDNSITAAGYLRLECDNTNLRVDNWEGGNVIPPALNQHSFRFFNDDGSESTATSKAALNTNVNVAANDIIRLRFLIDATLDPTGKQFQLEYRRKPSGGSFGEWNKVN